MSKTLKWKRVGVHRWHAETRTGTLSIVIGARGYYEIHHRLRGFFETDALTISAAKRDAVKWFNRKEKDLP